MPDEDDDDEVIALDRPIDLRQPEGRLELRHELVTGITVTRNALRSLRGRWDRFSPEEREMLLEMAERRAAELEHLIQALVDRELR